MFKSPGGPSKTRLLTWRSGGTPNGASDLAPWRGGAAGQGPRWAQLGSLGEKPAGEQSCHSRCPEPRAGQAPSQAHIRGLLAPGRRGKSSLQSVRADARGVAMETGGAELWTLSGRPAALLPQSTCPSTEASTWLHCVPGQRCHLPAVRGPLGGAQGRDGEGLPCQLLGWHIGRPCGGGATLPGERQPGSRIQVLSVGGMSLGSPRWGGGHCPPSPSAAFKGRSTQEGVKGALEAATYSEGQVKVKVSREARRAPPSS